MEKLKPMKLTFNKERSISWSQISSFEYNKEQWYSRYVLGEKSPENIQMGFGKTIGDKLSSDPKFLPEVLRYPIFEQKLVAKIDDFTLIGYLDSFDPKTKNFYEYKTSSNTKKWTKKSAQEHGQILFYLFLIYKTYKVSPETVKVKLFYIPVEEDFDNGMELSRGAKVEVFDIKHTSLEVAKFGKYIKDTRKKMIKYCEQKSLQNSEQGV